MLFHSPIRLLSDSEGDVMFIVIENEAFIILIYALHYYQIV